MQSIYIAEQFERLLNSRAREAPGLAQNCSPLGYQGVVTKLGEGFVGSRRCAEVRGGQSCPGGSDVSEFASALVALIADREWRAVRLDAGADPGGP